ncbi:MAG: hypothetical protein PHE09_17545 [Oscillospiraceae bacterium]|nr:hypothetical protein [Oscillospiraceae bacterium]
MIEKMNASNLRMEEIEIFGIPALFTPHRLSRATIHLEIFCYEIQIGSETNGAAFCLTDEAAGPFYGTVLTPIPVELPPNGRRIIESGDFITDLGIGRYTIAEFDEKYFSPSVARRRDKEWYE